MALHGMNTGTVHNQLWCWAYKIEMDSKEKKRKTKIRLENG